MAKAEIEMPYIEEYPNMFYCTVRFKYKAGYKINVGSSLRIYYSTTNTMDSNTPYQQYNLLSDGAYDPAVKSYEVKDGWTVVVCQLPYGSQLSDNTTYWLRARLQLYKSNGDAYKKYRAPKNPTPVTTSDGSKVRKLFQIAEYRNPYTDDDGEVVYQQSWVDFTQYIPAPSYDVNLEDIDEDWTDANYVTHRIVPRTKIKGSLELLFTEKEQYNRFLKLLKMNKLVNGAGYTQLKVQVNDDIDIYSNEIFIKGDATLDLANRPCKTYIGMFFIKMENNPFAVPLFGHYDQYEPLRLEIEEA